MATANGNNDVKAALENGEKPENCKVCVNDVNNICFIGDYNGIYYPAHKTLLENASGYFREYFERKKNEVSTGFDPIYVTDVEPAALVQCLDFIYTGYLGVTMKNLRNFAEAALVLKMDAVWDYCVSYAVTHVDFDTFFDLRMMAASTRCPALLDATEMYALCNFELLMGHEEFALIDKTLLLLLLENKKLKMIPETKVYEAVMSWINFDPSKRKHNLPELMKYVNLEQIPVDYLKEVVHAEQLVMGDTECRNLLEEALWSHIHPSNAAEDGSSVLIQAAMMIFDQNLENVKSYNPWSGRWREYAPLPGIEVKFVAVSVGRSVFILGTNRRVFNLDTVDNKWREMAKMGTERGEIRAAVLDGQIYTSGGVIAPTGKCMRTAERFDPETNTWQKLQSMKKPRAKHCVAATSLHVYAIGGVNNNNTAVKLVERMAPKQAIWLNAAPMKRPRSGAICAVKDDSIYIIGGTFTPDVSIEVLNGAASGWTTINIPIPVNFIASCVIGEDIYLLCNNDDDIEIHELQLDGEQPVFVEEIQKIKAFGALAVCSV